MGRPSRSASHLPYNYPQLQNLIKRDSESYREEFLQQYQHFKSSLEILQVRPDTVEDHFEALVMFIAHVRAAPRDARTKCVCGRWCRATPCRPRSSRGS